MITRGVQGDTSREATGRFKEGHSPPRRVHWQGDSITQHIDSIGWFDKRRIIQYPRMTRFAKSGGGGDNCYVVVVVAFPNNALDDQFGP